MTRLYGQTVLAIIGSVGIVEVIIKPICIANPCFGCTVDFKFSADILFFEPAINQ
jgi:hypothetical protein